MMTERMRTAADDGMCGVLRLKVRNSCVLSDFLLFFRPGLHAPLPPPR